MSQLYGVRAHASISQQLMKYKRRPLCCCCCHRKRKCKCPPDNTEERLNKQIMLNYDFQEKMVEFIQQRHLSVFAIEHRVKINGICGRIDAIFRANYQRKKLYIVDWKFLRYMPEQIDITYIIQLNLYRYMLQQMAKYQNYELEIFCFCFTRYQTLKIFECTKLSKEFIESFITRTYS